MFDWAFLACVSPRRQTLDHVVLWFPWEEEHKASVSSFSSVNTAFIVLVNLAL